jgi:hypothetical protein
VRTELQRLAADGRARVFGAVGVHVDVATQSGPCAQCHGPTRVQKTLQRGIVTIAHGVFQAHERVRVCDAGCRYPSGALLTRRSDALARLVPAGAVYGYDVEVAVGIYRLLQHRQRDEVRAMLKSQHGLELSSGTVSLLAGRFVRHLEELHQLRSPALRQALAGDGGYPLHVDATGEDGRGTLFMAYAGSRAWVLGAWKLATERAELILPCLRQTAASFGSPMAIVRDFGRAIIPAARALVAELGRPIPILGCHFHFLRDVGNDLLKPGYDQLRALCRRFGLRSALRKLARDLGRRLRGLLPALRGELDRWAATETDHVLPDGPRGLAAVRALAQWALDYATDARTGIPFDLPYLAFYERCYTVRRAADAFLRRPVDDARVRAALRRLVRVLDPVVAEVPFAHTAQPLAARSALFNELRHALRLRPDRDTPERPASPDEAAEELRDIRAAIDDLTRSLRERRPQRGPAQDTRQAIDLILDHLDRHGDALWGHVIPLPDGGIRVVDRTNQRAEAFWHQLKHGERRRSGRKVLTYDFETLPAAAALACNLRHADYVTILCGSLDQLPAAFADLDQARHRRALTMPASESIASVASKNDDDADADHPSAEIDLTDLDDVVSASFPRDDRRLIRTPQLRERIQTAARSRAPRYTPR